MKRIIFIIAAALSGAWIAPASAQAITATLPVTCNASGSNCIQATPVVNPDGTTIAAGGGGDATAANQATQITAAQLTNTTLGAVTASPTANTIGDRLKVINTTLGTPYQAGGALPLPSGASTSANQSTLNATIGTPASAIPATGLTVGGTDGTNFRALKTDTAGDLTIIGIGTNSAVVVAGDRAHDATNTGNPVQIGGVASDVLCSAVSADADRVSACYSRKGSAYVEQAGRPYCHISTSTTTTCKSGAGSFGTININSLGTVASTVTIYDNTAGSGTVIAVIDTLSGATGTRTFNISFATGLTIVTTGTVAPDITVTYR